MSRKSIVTPRRGGRRADCVHEEMGFLWARMTGGLPTSRWKRMRLGFCATFPDEGATSMAANCALYLAEHGKRVVLAETDLRHAGLAAHFKVSASPGFWELMEGRASADAASREVAPRLELVPAGDVPRHFSPELDDEELDRAIRALDDRCDVLVCDLPPLSTSPEAVAFLRHVDSVVLVVRANRTAKRDVRRSAKTLSELGVRLVGTLLNDRRYEVPGLLAKVL